MVPHASKASERRARRARGAKKKGPDPDPEGREARAQKEEMLGISVKRRPALERFLPPSVSVRAARGSTAGRTDGSLAGPVRAQAAPRGAPSRHT